VITVTTVIENVFCPKFTYYGMVMGIKQYEEKRGTVMSGRRHHNVAEKTNTSYVPKNLRGRKITSVKMYSKKYDLVGIVDECIVTSDEIVIIERKHAKQQHIHDSVTVQIGLLALLLEENFGKPVKSAYVIFAKDHNRNEVAVSVDQTMKNYALAMLDETKKIINTTVMPDSSYDSRCVNCCYRKICDVGSLNTT